MTLLSRLLAACAFAACAAQAQTYPSKPIVFVNTFPPGGGSDVITRLLAAKLAPQIGQQVIVENRAGATGTIGTTSVARAAPDGYTMLFATAGAIGVAPALYRNLAYDPVKSFAPVIEVARGHFALLVTASLPVNNATELIAHARRNPGKLNYGSAGQGSVHHLAGEILRQATGIDIVHVPFKGTGPAFPALIAGDIQIMFEGGASWIPHVRSGRLRAIAVSGPRRIPLLPDIPTFAEQGIQGVEPSFWWGVLLPAGAPRPVIDKLNAEFRQVLNDPEVRNSLQQQGAEATPGTPEAFGRLVADEAVRWKQVVAAAGVKPE